MQTAINQFNSPQAWRLALGLLPVPMLQDEKYTNKYVLLNGQTGNFCLDLTASPLGVSDSCSSAWSSNVGHYVGYTRDYVEVRRWDRPDKSERYSTASVIKNLEKFHEHLEKDDPGQEKSIVRFCLSIYRTLRQHLRDEENGFNSLKALLLLLASTSEREDISRVNTAEWGIPADAQSIVSSMHESDLENVIFQMQGFGLAHGLRPNFKLLLRHASGALFQEAHFQANIQLQMWLPGFGPANLEQLKTATTHNGIFFTPQSIARTLAEEAIRHIDLQRPSLVIYDPTCGSGELLKEALRILELKRFSGTVKLVGRDSSSAAIDMARFILKWEARSWGEDRVTVDLETTNSLEGRWPQDVDILMMNPPFKSWQLMSPLEQNITASILNDLLHYKPNLAAVFTALALDSVAEDGVLAMVSPCSLYDAHSTSKLRERMLDVLEPKLLAKLGNQSLFFNAMVDTCLFVGKKIQKLGRRSDTILVWADHSKDAVSKAFRSLRKSHDYQLLPDFDDTYSVYYDPTIGERSFQWLPRPYTSWLTFTKASHAPKAILASKAYDIKQGARLGHDVFVVSKSYLTALPEDERLFFRPAVMNLSIQQGKLADSHYVFFPYGQDLPRLTTVELLMQHVPTYFDRCLQPEEAKLSKRKYKEGTGNWWDLGRPCTWQFEKSPKLVSKYFGKKEPFAWDKEGDYVAVVGQAWLPKPTYFDNAKQSPDAYAYAMLAYLNSGFVEKLISFISAHVGGGQMDLSKKYLSSLPIPDLKNLPASILSTLTEMGMSISLGEAVDSYYIDEACESAIMYIGDK